MRSMRELLVIPTIVFVVVGVLFVQSALVFAEGGAVRVYTEDESAVKSNDTVTSSSGSGGSSGGSSGSEPDTKSEGCTASVQKAADAGDKAAQQKCPKEKQGTVTYTTPEGTEVTCGKGPGAVPECTTDMMDAIIQDKGNAYYTTPDGEKTSLNQFKDQQLNSLKAGDYSALNDAFGKDDLESRIEGLEQQAQAIRDKGGDPTLVISADPKTLDAWKNIESWEGGPKPEQSIIEAIRKDGAVRMDIPKFSPSASAWTWDNTVGQFLGTFGGKTLDFGNGGFMSVSPTGQTSFSFQNNPAGMQTASDFSSARNDLIGSSGLFPNTFPQTSALIRDGSGLLSSQSPLFAAGNSNPFTSTAVPGIVLSPLGKDGSFMQWDPVQGKFVPIQDPTKLTPVDPNEPSSLIKTALKSPLLGENTDLKDFDKVAINDVPKVFDLEDGTNVAPGITTAPVQDEKLEALGISTERPTLNSIVETARESGGNAVARSLSLLERWGLSDGFTVRDFANLPTLNDFRMANLPEGTEIVGITNQEVASREGNVSASQTFLKENEWRLRMQENGRALYEAKQTLGEKVVEYQKAKEGQQPIDQSRYLAAEDAINKFADEKGLTLDETGKLVPTRNLTPQEMADFNKLSKEYASASEELAVKENESRNALRTSQESYQKALSDYQKIAAEFDYTNQAYRTEKEATVQVLKDYYSNTKFDAFGNEIKRFDAFGREYTSGLAASLQDSTSKSIIESQTAQAELETRIASLRTDRASFIEQSAGDVNTFAGMGAEGWPSPDRASVDAGIKEFDAQITAAESELAKLKAQETLNSGISRSLLDAGDSSKASPTADAIAKTILDPGTSPQDLARREALLNTIVKGETVRAEQSRFTDYVKENILNAQEQSPTKQITAAIERWRSDLETQTSIFGDKLAKANNQIQELVGVKEFSPETQKLVDAISGDNLTDRQKSRAADYEYYKNIAESWKPDPNGTLRVLDPSWWKAGAAGYAAHVVQNIDTLESFVTGQGALKDTQLAGILDNSVERGARIVSAGAELAMDAMIVTDTARLGTKFFSTTGRELALAEANLGTSGLRFQPSFIDELAGAEAKAAQVYAGSVAKTVEAEVASGTIRPFEAEARAYGNLYDTLARSDLSPIQKQSVLGALAAEMETKGFTAPIRGAEGVAESSVVSQGVAPLTTPGVEGVVVGSRFTPPGAVTEAFNEGSAIAGASARQAPSYISTEGTLITPQNISALDEVRAATEQSVRAATLSVLEAGGEVTPARIVSALDQNALSTALQGISEKYGGMQFKEAAIVYEQTVAANSAIDAVQQIGGGAPVTTAPRDVVETLSRTPLSEWKDAVTLTPPQRLNKVVTDYLSNTAAEVSPKSGNFNRNFSAALAEPERAASFTKAVRALEQQTGKKFSESEISSALAASRPTVEKEWAEMASAAGTTVPASTLLKRIQDSAANTLAALTPDIAGKPLRSAVLAMQLLSTPIAPHIGTQTLGGALVRGASIASEVLNPISSAVAREVNTSGSFTRTGLAPQDAVVVYAQPQKTLATTYGFAGDAFNPSLRTSSGYVLDPNLLSAAHRELPLGSVVKVTNTENGKEVAVVINNRGKLKPNKLIDLSPGAQAELRGKSISSVNKETTPVKYELMYVPPRTIANRYEENPATGTFREMAGLTRAQSAAIVANPEVVKNLSFGAQGDLTPLARVQTNLASGDVVGASRAAVGNTLVRDVIKVLDTPPLGDVPVFKPATIEGVIVPVTKAAENIQSLAETAQKAVLKAAEDMGASMITARNVKTADDAVRALTQQAKEVEGALARLGAQSAEHAPEALDALKQLRKAQTELKGVMNESLSPESVNRAFAKVVTEVDKSHTIVDAMAKARGVVEDVPSIQAGGRAGEAASTQNSVVQLPPARFVNTYANAHPVIASSMKEAAKHLPPGYTVQVISAGRTGSTVGGSSLHVQRDGVYGLAVDVQIYDAAGNKLTNIRSPQNFELYRTFMQNVKAYQDRLYPELKEQGRWGGYFVGGVPQDLMHYDLGGARSMAAGSWSGGLSPQYAFYATPGQVGKGMGNLATYQPVTLGGEASVAAKQSLPERITSVRDITREIADAASLTGRRDRLGDAAVRDMVAQAQKQGLQQTKEILDNVSRVAKSSGQLPIPGAPGRVVYLPGSEFSASIPQRAAIVIHDQWGVNALARAQLYHNGRVENGTRYWVTRDGDIVIARRDGVVEAHVGENPPKDVSGRMLYNVTNSNSVGIEFEGHGFLTEKQKQAGLALTLFLQARHDIAPTNIFAHQKGKKNGIVEGVQMANLVGAVWAAPQKITEFFSGGLTSIGQTVREAGARTAGWISDNVRGAANTAQEQIRYVMKGDAAKTAAAQPKMRALSGEAQKWFADSAVVKANEPVRMAASRYGLPEGPIGYGIGMSTPAGIPSNVKVVFGPYIDTMPQFAQAARAQGITPAGYVNTVCQGSLCAGYVQAGKARLEVIGGHREFRFTDQATMLECVGMQIDGMKQLGIRSADFDNIDGYAQSWVASVVDLANQKDFGVWLKNPNLMKGDVASIVKKPNVVGFFVENDPTSTLGNLLKLRADAGRPDVTVLFAGGHGQTGPWIRNLQAEVATGKYQNVAVSVGPAGEYQGVVATAWAPPAGSAQGVAGRATSLPVLPEKFHQEVKLSYPQSKGVEAQIWFNDGTNRFPITQEQLRTLSPEVAQANVTVDVLFNNGVKNVSLAEAPKALEGAFVAAAKAAAPDPRAVLGKNLIDKGVVPRGAPVITASKNPLFKTETSMPISFGDGARGSAALRTFATPEYARGYAGMMAAVKEGKVPTGIKQVPGEPLVWSDPQTPRYQYRADVDGARVTVTKIDTQGQKSLTPNSKLFQPQQVFETSIEKPQMGIVTVTKRTTDTVVAKSDGGTAVSGKDVGDTPVIKPTDTSVTAPTPANPTTPLGPISIINAPGEAARAASEPPLSGWKKAAAVFAGVIAAPLAYLGIGNDSVNTAPPAATAPQAPTTTKEAVVEEIPVDVPAGLEGDGCVTKVAADLGVNVECPTPAASATPPPQTPPSQMPPGAGRGGDGRGGLGTPGSSGQPQMPQAGQGSPQGGAPIAAGKPPVPGSTAGGATPSVPGVGVNNGTTDRSLAQLTCPVATIANTPFSVKWVCAPGMTSQGTGFSTGGLISGTATTSITATTTFGLACAGTGAAAATCTTRIVAPKTVLTAAPTEVDPGQKVVIAWVTTETTNCSLYGPQSILRSGGTTNVHVIPSITRSTEFALACGTTGGTTIKRTVVVRVRGSAGEIDPALVPEADIQTTPVTDTPFLWGSDTPSGDSNSSDSSQSAPNTNIPGNTNPSGYTATDQNGNPVTLCDPMMGIYRFTQCLLKKPY